MSCWWWLINHYIWIWNGDTLQARLLRSSLLINIGYMPIRAIIFPISKNDLLLANSCNFTRSIFRWSVVTCLPLDPRIAGSNPSEDDGFLRVIKILRTTFFGREVKPSIPCSKILRHVKETLRYDSYFVGKIRQPFPATSLLPRY
jgi:hypothetical protein